MSRSRRPQKNAKGRQPKSAEPRDFWGNADAIPDLATPVRPTFEPSAIVGSLGQPPLAGHEVIAEHYFRAVYDKAAGLAIAIAAAGGLLDDGSSSDD